MTIEEAIRELLDVSTDIGSVAVLDASGEVLASGPAPIGARVGEAAGRLWEAAARRAGASGDAPLEHALVPSAPGAVAIVAAHGRRIVAVTGPRPAAGLLLFDLRTCLDDAFAEQEGAA